jgi:C_GCAxxG_C_C family probable redox protein
MRLEPNVEEIRGRFGNGVCCAMSVFGELAEWMGMDKETARKIASGFCGHYEQNNFCGCISGAKMALGMKYGPSRLGDNDKAAVLKQKIKAFEQDFAAQFGSIRCPEILGGLDPSVEEDRPEIISRDLFHRTCTDAVCFAIRRVSEMLEEKQET